MGTYFGPAVTQQDIQTALNQATAGTQAGQTTVATGSAGVTTAPDNTTPYATPSSFADVPINQLGPYNAYSAWGSLDPNAMVTTGPGKGTPLVGQAMIGQIAQAFEASGYGKPTGNTEDWVIAQIQKHYKDQGGHLMVIPTKGGRVAPTTPAKAKPVTAADLAGIDLPGGIAPGSNGPHPGGTPGREGMPERVTPPKAPPAEAGGPATPEADRLWRFSPRPGVPVLAEHDTVQQPTAATAASPAERTRNNGASHLLQAPDGRWVWASVKNGQWVPDRNQADNVPPAAAAASTPGNGLMPVQPSMDPKVKALFQHLGLPVATGVDPWKQIANAMGVQTTVEGAPTQMKAGDVATNIQTLLNNGQLSNMQDLLWQGGFYDAKNWTPGQLDIATKQAYGGLLKQTAALNAEGGKYKYVTAWDVLQAEINNEKAQGGIDALAAETASKKYTAATESQMDQPTLNAFEARLGRAPTAAELAAVTSQMDAQQQAHAETMPTTAYVVPGEGGVSSVPGVTTPTALAAQYAMTQDPNEYEGHSLANAYGLMINALSSKPVGSDPNITSVSRPL